MKRRPPIRTYLKNCKSTFTQPIQNGIPVSNTSAAKQLSENAQQNFMEITMQDDLFDTTFDRLAKNAKIHIAPPAYTDEKSWLNSSSDISNGIVNTRNSKSIQDLISEESTTHLNSYKICTKLKNGKKTIVQKTSLRKLKATMEINENRSPRVTQKRKKRNLRKAAPKRIKTTNKKNISHNQTTSTTINLTIDSDKENECIEEHRRHKNSAKTKLGIKNYSVTSQLIPMENDQLNNETPILSFTSNKHSLAGYNKPITINLNDVNIQMCSKNIFNKQSDINFTCANTKVIHDLRIHKNQDLICSTPISGRKKLLPHTVEVSPIPLKHESKKNSALVVHQMQNTKSSQEINISLQNRSKRSSVPSFFSFVSRNATNISNRHLISSTIDISSTTDLGPKPSIECFEYLNIGTEDDGLKLKPGDEKCRQSDDSLSCVESIIQNNSILPLKNSIESRIQTSGKEASKKTHFLKLSFMTDPTCSMFDDSSSNECPLFAGNDSKTNCNENKLSISTSVTIENGSLNKESSLTSFSARNQSESNIVSMEELTAESIGKLTISTNHNSHESSQTTIHTEDKMNLPSGIINLNHHNHTNLFTIEEEQSSNTKLRSDIVSSKEMNGSNTIDIETLAQLQDSMRVTNRRKKYKWAKRCANVFRKSDNDIFPLESQEKLQTPETGLRNFTENSKQDTEVSNSNQQTAPHEKFVYLKPGKSWTRSLSILTNIRNGIDIDEQAIGKGKKWRHSVKDVLNMQEQNDGSTYKCARTSTNHNNLDSCEHIANRCKSNRFSHKCNILDPPISCRRPSKRNSFRVVQIDLSLKCKDDESFLRAYGFLPIDKSSKVHKDLVSTESSLCTATIDINGTKIDEDYLTRKAKEVVLQRCMQQDYIPFAEYFTDLYLEKCKKIGEGVYGEVFLYQNEDEKSVIKIIPIEGDQYVNGEPQKKFNEILSEIVITKELDSLRLNNNSGTDAFVEVKNIKCIIGTYPKQLIELWNDYDQEKRSDNDCPTMFNENQLYITLELGHGGQDLESFIFHTAEEALAAFQQIAFALAIAEITLQFEHRDMHWGNVLISRTEKPYVHYTLMNQKISLCSKGVKVSIIDFTLSRMSYKGCCIFNDLALDPALFTAQGEYQFEVYRLMRDKVANIWQNFEPFTNVLWLHYTLDKMITAVRYRKKTLKVHKIAISKLTKLYDGILDYKSCYDFVNNSTTFREYL